MTLFIFCKSALIFTAATEASALDPKPFGAHARQDSLEPSVKRVSTVPPQMVLHVRSIAYLITSLPVLYCSSWSDLWEEGAWGTVAVVSSIVLSKGWACCTCETFHKGAATRPRHVEPKNWSSIASQIASCFPLVFLIVLVIRIITLVWQLAPKPLPPSPKMHPISYLREVRKTRITSISSNRIFVKWQAESIHQ